MIKDALSQQETGRVVEIDSRAGTLACGCQLALCLVIHWLSHKT
jgi:hypothetical protein